MHVLLQRREFGITRKLETQFCIRYLESESTVIPMCSQKTMDYDLFGWGLYSTIYVWFYKQNKIEIAFYLQWTCLVTLIL